MPWNDKQFGSAMSIDNLRTRLEYYGKNAEDRIVKDKRRSLNKALLYSYQGVTISLLDRNDVTKFTRDYRALLNPNKLNMEYDNKILSIPYDDIQLNAPRVGKTSEGRQDIGIRCGDVFYWAETDTYWITYMQYLNERAYFRAEVRLCEHIVEVEGVPYHVYFRGPIEQNIEWAVKKGDIWNNLNYSAVMFITYNEQTSNFFHRFTKFEIDGETWEVQVRNKDCGNGILKLALKEAYNNSIEKENEAYQKAQEELKQLELAEQGLLPEAYISGPEAVKPYDIVTYEVHGMPYDKSAVWQLSNKKASILSVNDFSVTIEIITGKQGQIELSYIYGPETDDRITYQISVKSL